MLTTFAAFTNIIALYYFISVFCFTLAVISVCQLFAVRTGEEVTDFIIAEILYTIDVAFVFLYLADLIVGRFDVRVLLILFKIGVILLARISCVSDDVCVFSSYVFSQSFQERY